MPISCKAASMFASRMKARNFSPSTARPTRSTPDNLMIADEARAVGIGGVMGGEDTGVTATTRNVLLESAYFLPSSIRRTARTLNLPSDASYRFERGVDPAMTLRASERATQLIARTGGRTTGRTGQRRREKCRPRPRTWRCVTSAATGFSASRFRGRTWTTVCSGLVWQPVESDRGGGDLENSELPRRSETRGRSDRGSRAAVRDPTRSRQRIAARLCAVSAADRRADLDTRFLPTTRGDGDLRSANLIAYSARRDRRRRRRSRAAQSIERRSRRASAEFGARLLDVLARNQNMGATSIRLFELGRVFLPPDAKEKRALALLFSGEATEHTALAGGDETAAGFLRSERSDRGASTFPNLSFRRTENPAYAFAAEIVSGDQVDRPGGPINCGARREVSA